MNKYFQILTSALLVLSVALFFAACDTTDNPTTPDDPDVSAPTNLKAYSDNNKIGLTWTASTSESQTNFATYEITVTASQTGQAVGVFNAAKGSTSYTITGLTNGTRYTAIVRSKTTKGKTSTDQANIEWAPAVRNATDKNGVSIDVYATTSTQPKSGVLLNGAGNLVEVVSQAQSYWKQNGDLFLYAATSSSTTLELRSPHLATNNTGDKTTQFWKNYYEVDNFDGGSAITSPPPVGEYTDSKIDLADASVSRSRVYFARIQGTGTNRHTVRILVKRGANGKLVQGSGADRFIMLEVSLQTDPNNPFAKK